MSARRQARGRAADLSGSADGLPRVLALGRCVEVWQARPGDVIGGYGRFSAVRLWWLRTEGVRDGATQWRLIPSEAPWSIDDSTILGRDEAWIAERLAGAGCTRADLPKLQREARQLHARTLTREPTRKAAR